MTATTATKTTAAVQVPMTMLTVLSSDEWESGDPENKLDIITF